MRATGSCRLFLAGGAAWLGLLSAGIVHGQDVIAFDGGYLTFTNVNPDLYYTVEYRPALLSPEDWDGTYDTLKNIKTDAPTVTVPVGIYYRVVGHEIPQPTGRPQQTGQTISYAASDDGDVQRGVPWPDPRFTVTTNAGDVVVSDNLTGLMWTQHANLAGAVRWTNAVDFCDNLTYADFSDWRLPNVLELASLVDFGNSGPALPSGHPFVNVQIIGEEVWYWTSTTYAGLGIIGWRLEFFAGLMTIEDKSDNYFVWPVRDGQ
jgi:hypothetical protein